MGRSLVLATLINGLYAGLFCSAVTSFLLMTVFIRIFARVTLVPSALLAPGLLMLGLIASYASAQSMADLFAAVAFGLLGYALRRSGFPLVNLIMGFVLGRLMETSFAQSLMMSGGSYAVFFHRPVTLVLMGVMMLLLASRAWPRRRLGARQA